MAEQKDDLPRSRRMSGAGGEARRRGEVRKPGMEREGYEEKPVGKLRDVARGGG